MRVVYMQMRRHPDGRIEETGGEFPVGRWWQMEMLHCHDNTLNYVLRVTRFQDTEDGLCVLQETRSPAPSGSTEPGLASNRRIIRPGATFSYNFFNGPETDPEKLHMRLIFSVKDR